MIVPDDFIAELNLSDRIRVVPFHYGHIHMMQLSELDRRAASALPDFNERIQSYADAYPSMTVMIDNKIILSSGIFQLWPNTYELWMFKSDDLAKQNALDLTRKAKMFVSYTTQLSYLRRLQIVVRNDNTPAMRWAGLIGFNYEATLTAYTPDGVDCHVYTRFNHGFSNTEN